MDNIGTRMSTLVLHPQDSTTDFLDILYKDIENKKVVREFYGVSKGMLRNLIEGSDRVMILGHGSSMGLYDRERNETVFGDDLAPYLIGKEVIGIFCHADNFFTRNGIEGFYTGMFISEWKEAREYQVLSTVNEIRDSNVLFCENVRDAIKSGISVREYVKKNYLLEGNACVDRNRKFMHM